MSGPKVCLKATYASKRILILVTDYATIYITEYHLMNLLQLSVRKAFLLTLTLMVALRSSFIFPRVSNDVPFTTYLRVLLSK